MVTIWKYPLRIMDEQTLSMPEGATILSAQVQHESICVWALVIPARKIVDRVIHIVGTGHSVSAEKAKRWRFIDTVQLGGGSLVFHIFDEAPQL